MSSTALRIRWRQSRYTIYRRALIVLETGRQASWCGPSLERGRLARQPLILLMVYLPNQDSIQILRNAFSFLFLREVVAEHQIRRPISVRDRSCIRFIFLWNWVLC
jgi:hypothetical protein